MQRAIEPDLNRANNIESPSRVIQHGADFRVYLLSEFLRRRKNNSRYSLRAFAQGLKVDFSTLSKIMRGKRHVGPKTIAKLGEKLKLTSNEVNSFVVSSGKGRPGLYKQVEIDCFAIISDWYHYAILELLKLPSFSPNPNFIARALGISIRDARLAVERLVRVGMLEKKSPGVLVDKTGGYSTTLEFHHTTAALRTHQRQLLNKALLALEFTPFEKRYHSSMIMSIDSQKVPGAKKIITEFRRKLLRHLSVGKKQDGVYALTVALFPLSEGVNA